MFNNLYIDNSPIIDVGLHVNSILLHDIDTDWNGTYKLPTISSRHGLGRLGLTEV